MRMRRGTDRQAHKHKHTDARNQYTFRLGYASHGIELGYKLSKDDIVYFQ